MNEPSTRRMSFTEARECVDKINVNLTNIRALVLDLYEREGWSALGYKSWRECVVKEFNQSQPYLYQQLEAAQTERNISAIAENADKIPESQLRPLTKLKDNPKQQCEVWQRAVATAPNGKVTAAHIAKIVRGMTTVGQDKTSPEPQPQMPPDAIQLAENAIGQLDLISSCDPRREAGLGKLKQWLKDNTAQSEPKIRPGKCKIAALRRKQRWLLNNQIPIDMTPVG